MSDTPTSADDDQGQQEQSSSQSRVSFTAEQQEHINSMLAAQKSKARPADYDDLKARAAKLDELEQANKTELQKIVEERDTHMKRGDTAELQLARLEVALEKGLTATQAKRLVGGSRDELAADADELLTDLGAGKKQPPKPNPAQGRGEESTGSGDWLRDSLARK